MSKAASTHRSIPTVDFQDVRVSNALLEAATEWGCFRLVNHPIPSSLMAEMKGVANCLLDLPMEIKRRNVDVIVDGGYREPTNPNPLYESLGVYNIGSPQVVDDFCTLLEASPSQRETIVKYSKRVQELAVAIGRKLCQSMGLEIDDLFKDWTCQFRMIKYHFKPEDVGASGVFSHTDTGFLTLLYDDECVGGLEVIDEKTGEFVAVDPVPGSFVLNFGDMAKVWSNGKFCNAKHRVLCKKASPRISVALFVLGPKDVAIEAPPELVDEKHPRLYVPLMMEDYKELRFSTGLRSGEALALIQQ